MSVDCESVKQALERLAGAPKPGGGFRPGLHSNNSVIEMEYGRMLYGAVQVEKPETIVELGTGQGYATAWLLLGLEKNQSGQLWTVDLVAADVPVWRMVDLPEGRLKVLGNTPIGEAGGQLPERIDLLFHDAGHGFEEVRTDLERLLPRIPLNGCIIVHDVNYNRNMGDALAQWFDSMAEEWSYQEASMGCGMGIARRISVPPPPPKQKGSARKTGERKRSVKRVGRKNA